MGRLASWFSLVAAALTLIACTGGGNKSTPVPFVSVQVTAPAAPLTAGSTTVWTATPEPATTLYSLHWDFGGGAVPNTVDQLNVLTAGSTASVQLIAGAWHGSVQMTDHTGLSVTQPFDFTVGPPKALSVAAAYTGGRITLVSDSQSGPLTVAATDSTLFNLGVPATTTVNGQLGALVPVSAADPLAGASGEVQLQVTDGIGAQGGTTLHVAIAPVTLAADTLYAIPLQKTVRVGEPVTVLLATGPTAHPFEYMNGVGLTMPGDGAYIWDTLNYGAVGGQILSPDGIWPSLDPTGGFLLIEDGNDFPEGTDLQNGLNRWDFSISPLGAHALTGAQGALLNAKFKFTTPGVKTFGFQQLQGVKRTYYSDETQEYYWGNIANDGSGGIANSVLVTE